MADDGHQPATEWLDAEECRTLLALRGMGRVAFVADAFPMILPVNYTLVGDLLVFRTDPGTKLALLVQRASAKGELSLLALLRAIPGFVQHLVTSFAIHHEI